MSILKLPDIVYPLAHVNKTNEIIDVLNDNLNMYYSENNPTLISSEGLCTWTVTHNLGTENINYSIYEGSNSIIADVSITSENAITVTFNSSSNIAKDTYSIVVISNGAGSSTGGGGSITVDSELSTTSTNPVQNKVIYSSLSQLNYLIPNVNINGIVPVSQNNILGNFCKYSYATILENIVFPQSFEIVIDFIPQTFSAVESIIFSSSVSRYFSFGLKSGDEWVFSTGDGNSWKATSYASDISVTYNIEYMAKIVGTSSNTTLYISNNQGQTWTSKATAPIISSVSSSAYHLGNNREDHSSPFTGTINLNNCYIKDTSTNTYIWQGVSNKINI